MADRRALNFAGAAACAAALGYAFYAQYGLGLQPCHLCVFQRVCVAALGAVFLLAALHNPGRTGGRIYAGLIGVAGAATAATAGRHVWVQSQPPGSVAGCGADLDYMLELFPVYDVVLKVFEAGGECQVIDWQFLGLSMPAWVLGFAVVLTAAGVYVNWRAGRRKTDGIRFAAR